MNTDQPTNPPAPAAAPRATLPPGSGCVVCGLDQNANQILLCDGCDAEYHTYCLAPPLAEIPEGDFYCKSCKDAKRHLTPKPSADNGPTQAGFTVQDELGRMVPVRSEDVRESKYRGVLKLVTKGAKKPFVARIQKDGKFLQLGLFSSEIEAAHAYDKTAIQLFGRAAQLNFPHLHDGFVRPTTAPAATTTTVTTGAMATPVRPAPPASASAAAVAAAVASPSFNTANRGRGRGRGRGTGGRGGAGRGGSGKRRLEDSPTRESDATPNSAVKKRKPGVGEGDVPITTGPKYLGVQVYRGYAHAQIVVNGKTVNLGTFPTAVDAATAYDKAALKYFGGDINAAVRPTVELNFPHKRDQLLKQLIEENMHQKARQASGAGAVSAAVTSGATSSANRSMQSAKHNLSIKKLENWVLKLQRSVKLVEAAHRVQWDGLPLVKPEESEATEDQEAQQDIKLELLAGAGPTIKTDFTKKQQRLRSGASDIQDAVNLMIQELKIYADDTPVDAAFIAPPRSHAVLDLMSTARFLKLCSTINELAHFSVSTSGESEKTGSEEGSTEYSFEALVQTVVDYRTRLQMAASSEKQKLASLVESESGSTPESGEAAADGASSGSASTMDVLSRELLRNSKYVKRKIQRIRKVKKVVETVETIEAGGEEKVEEFVASPSNDDAKEKSPQDEQAPVDASDAMEVEQSEAVSENVAPSGDSESADYDTSKGHAEEGAKVIEEHSEPASESVENVDDDQSSVPVVAEAVQPVADEAQPVDAAPASKVEEGASDDTAKVNSPVIEAASSSLEETNKAADEEKVPASPVDSKHEAGEPKPNEDDQVMEDISLTESADTSVAVVAESNEPASEEVIVSVVTSEVTNDKPEEEVIVEDVWEYCLALKPQQTSSRGVGDKDGMWRLLPLDSEKGEFVQDLFLTDDEIAEMEVAESEVCGGKRDEFNQTNDPHAWASKLTDLHKNEVTLRDRVKAEAERRAALEGVIKIEQERLSQVFVVYRRMLESITAKASDAQKKHQRITRDLLLVELMKETFAPILDELLQQCDSVFLERLEKLSDRFEDFQQEFEYYTEALVSVTGTSLGQENGHLKEETDVLPNGAITETDEEEDNTGLRGAYVSFYMEEIESLWKERCRAVESLFAILRSLTFVDGENPAAEQEAIDVLTGASVLRRRVLENLEQWKSVEWPTQLATPSFMSSFLGEGSSRAPSVQQLLPTAKQTEQSAVGSAMGELKQIIIDLTQEGPSSSSTRVVRHSTLVAYHPVFLDHQTPKDHPECPERLNRIITNLNTLRKKFDDALKIDRLTQSADELSPAESTLLAVHSPAYLQQLKDRSREASAPKETTGRGPVSLATPALVFETNRGAVDLPTTGLSETRASPTGSMGGAFGAFNTVPTGIAMDTYVSSKSWDVARAAAGTVCLAVDRVVRKEFRNAACLVRPPGHHVGRHGRTLDAPSSGFCLLNNVVIGAVHARQYPWIRRVAVLDWDIHHGNGTEELMRDDPDGFFSSVHLYASGKFFPGTGKSEKKDNLVNVALENSGIGSGSTAFRTALEEQILPAMRAFRPDIIFISAGFDGHKDDILGGRAAVKNTAVPAGYLEEDYVWATQEVLKIADECCDGRVISVLEGGYDVRKETNSLAKSVAAHIGAIASYEQERRQKESSVEVVEAAEGGVKTESSLGVLLSLLAKDLNDDDVVIIDDDEDDEEDPAADKSGLLSNGDVDVEDEDDLDDEDVDGDGVEVDEEDDGTHGHADHDDVDEDVVMTDEDHEGDHSVDEDDADAHSTGLSFAASLSVDGDDDEAQHSQEELEGHEVAIEGQPQPQGTRIETPEYDHLEGTGDEDEDMVGDHGDDDEEGDEAPGDLLGDEDHDSVGELPSLS